MILPEHRRLLQRRGRDPRRRCSAATCWRSTATSGAGWVKLEVLGDKKTLLPDPVGTIEATRELVKEGFTVLAYTSDDPRAAVRIKEAGAAQRHARRHRRSARARACSTR